jgi:hypothetical protein
LSFLTLIIIPDHRVIEQLGQFADAVRIKGQMHLSRRLRSPRHSRPKCLLEGLKQGKAVADLDRDFRTLERIQRCFLTEEKRHEENGEKVRNRLLEPFRKNRRFITGTRLRP